MRTRHAATTKHRRHQPLEPLSFTTDAASRWGLIGDVRTILYSSCTPDTLRHVSAPPFALGGAAVGRTAESAVSAIGEFLYLGGRPIWTPSGPGEPCLRVEPVGTSCFTPFLIQWNGVLNATFAFESTSGLDMLALYSGLFERTAALDSRLSSPLLAAVIVAETTTDKIHDKVMALPPTPEYAPSDGKPTTDEAHLDRHFTRNVTQKLRKGLSTYPQKELVIIVGVAVDLRHPGITAFTDSLSRGFYITPNQAASAMERIHNHGLILAGPTVSIESLRVRIQGGQIRLPEAASGLVSDDACDLLCMVHIENNTVLHRGLAGVGIIPP